MHTILTLGSFTLTRYGLCSALALAVCFAVWILYGCKKGVSYPKMLGACILSVLPILVFSRLLYALSRLPWYCFSLERPDLMLAFWDGGASLMGAIIGLCLTAVIMEKIYGEKRGTMTNGLVFALPVGICLMRLNEIGTLLGSGYEVPAGWPAFLSVTDELGTVLHAVNLYEAAAVLILLIVMIVWISASGRRMPAGDPLLLFLTLYGFLQILFEAMRNDQHMVLHFVRISQVTALLFILYALLRWTLRYRRYVRKGVRPLITWGLTLLFVGAAVAADFMIDRSEFKFAAWGLLAAADLGLLINTLAFRVRANYVAGE